MRPRARFAILAAVTLALALVAALSPARADDRAAAIVYDVIAGEALYEDNADARRYPASLTKIMTIYITFEELAAGRIKLDDQISMSEWASSRPPSKLGIRPGGTIKVRDAIKALVTKSANDVATALGEAIAGSEPEFAERMTRTAERLGMSKTVFKNASGLPNPGQYTTARDLAILGLRIQRDFPQYYGVFQTRVFQFGKRRIGNHNRLLGSVEGVDGIKTGYINASGFNLVTSVRRDGRQLVAVVLGGATGGGRDARMRKLIAAWLPKAMSGDAIAVAEWNDNPVIPRPGRKPSLATRFASNLKRQADDPIAATVLAFAAETRAAVGTDRVVADRRTTSAALQAVIAQAGADAGFSAPAPEPLPSTPAAVVAARAEAPSLADEPAPEGTDLGEVVEEVVLDVAAASARSYGGARFASAFDVFDENTDPALQVSIANGGAPTGASTISRGGVRVYAHRVTTRPRGRTEPVRQHLTRGPDAAPAPTSTPAVVPDRRGSDDHASAAPAPSRSQIVAAANAAAKAGAPKAAAIAPARRTPPAGKARPQSADGAALALAASGETPAEAAANQAAGLLAPRWHIQVGAVPTRDGAMTLLDDLAKQEPALAQRSRLTSPVSANGATFYRARFSGFASEGEARAACELFANHNRPCWAVSM